jgi:hypothetical protein
MVKRLLATTVVLGFLGFGATVTLEAVGVLFHVGVADPEQRAEAFLARLEADLNSPDLPTEPVEMPSAAGQERPERGAQGLAAVEPMQEEHRAVAFVQERPHRNKGERMLAAAGSESRQGPLAAATALPEASRIPLSHEALELAGPAASQVPAAVIAAATVPSAPRSVRGCAGPCEAKSVALRPGPPPTRRPARPPRPAYARASAAGTGGSGCPVLDWLDSVIAAPFASTAARSATDRRATM